MIKALKDYFAMKRNPFILMTTEAMLLGELQAKQQMTHIQLRDRFRQEICRSDNLYRLALRELVMTGDIMPYVPYKSGHRLETPETGFRNYMAKDAIYAINPAPSEFALTLMRVNEKTVEDLRSGDGRVQASGG